MRSTWLWSTWRRRPSKAGGKKEGGGKVPTILPRTELALLNRLSELNGSAFDSRFQQAQLTEHRQTSLKLKRHLQIGRDEDVRAYAIKTEPAVVSHLEMLKKKPIR